MVLNGEKLPSRCAFGRVPIAIHIIPTRSSLWHWRSRMMRSTHPQKTAVGISGMEPWIRLYFHLEPAAIDMGIARLGPAQLSRATGQGAWGTGANKGSCVP